MKLNKTIALLGIATVLSGCALTTTQERINTAKTTAVELRDLNLSQATSATVSRTAKPRLAGEEIVLRSQNALPAIFSRQVTYATHGAQSLSEVFESIGQMSGIPVRANEIGSSTGSTNGGASPFGMPVGGAQSNTGLSGKVQVEFTGSLRGLLDELASRSEASWRYSARSGAIEFFRFETRTLSIYLPPGSKTIDASISLSGVSGGGGGGGGGASGGGGGASAGGSGGSGGGATAGNVSVSQTMTVNPWSSIMDVVSAILSEGSSQQGAGNAGGMSPMGGPGGGAGGGKLTASGSAGRAAANPELGILTITARPRAVERVAAYVESINARFAQNVLIDIKIYSLTMDNQASLGFSLDTVYKYLNQNGVNIVGAAPLQAGTGSPGQLTISVDNPRSRLYGSSLVAQALSQFGNVALQTQGQVLAVNGQPAPIQVANEVNYLASSSLTQAPNVGSTATLTPGTRVVGFTANFIPLLLGDNRILLQYQMQLSSLTALTQVSSGNSSIQTPQISSQSLQQQAFVKDGQSIVLFGFDQNRDAVDTAMGLGSASRAARAERQMVVIVMTVNGGRKDV